MVITSSDANTISTKGEGQIEKGEILESETSQDIEYRDINILDDLKLDKQIYEVLNNIPEKNPDGSLWKLFIGDKVYDKKYIIENWHSDKKLREKIRKMLLSLKFNKMR